MRKLNVLQLMTDSKIGGAESVVLMLAKGLDKEKFNVSVCCLTQRGPIFDEAEKEGIKIYSLEIKNRWYFFRVFKLIKLLKSENIKILHSHLFHANLLARIIGKFMNVPVIISSEHIMGMESRWRLFLNRLTSGFVDIFIAVSFAVRDFLIKQIGIKSSKIAVVQNGIEYDRFQDSNLIQEKKRIEFGFTPEDKIIGTVARIHEQKGHVYLLYAAQEVIKDFPTVKFLIVGDGPLKSAMEKLSVNLGIANNIIFTGFYKDIPGILSILDIFVLPSLWEGLPITILEAMAMKKPVIATSVSGNPEAIDDNVTGILVPPKDSGALVKAIMKLLQNDNLRTHMGNAGYDRLNRLFNAERMVDEVTRIYERLIEEKNVKVY